MKNMKALIIAEKPSVARDIARVLSCSKSGNGFLEGKDYVVTWALGHLVTLSDPEEYDKKYVKWEMETLPMLPEQMKLTVIRQTSSQYQKVKTQLFRQDVDRIIIATDAGREGELVARWILDKSGCHKPLQRLWISSVTDKAIREGFQNLKDGREYLNLYRAAAARAEADWLVGINGTRALTCKYNAQLALGRVQTPTLAMISMREEEIHRFVPESYYGIQANAGSVQWAWRDEKSKGYRSFQKEKTAGICRALEGERLRVIHVNKKQRESRAPGLYDLTTLQREANRRFGFSAKETLNIMQRLYEQHKVLTYPRTDSRYIGTDVVPTLRERLKACAVGPYKTLAAVLLRGSIKTNKSFVDDKKVSDHHAIIPTEQFVQLDHMTIEERRIYDMVVRRFLSVLYPPCRYEQTAVEANIGSETFTAAGKRMIDPGFRVVYEEDSSAAEETEEREGPEEQMLPELREGQVLRVERLHMTEGRTKPPAYFTEATLLGAMENPARYVTDRRGGAVEILNETGGLGTVATRADIIEKLFSSFMIEKKGNEIHLTAKGRQLLTLVPEDLRKPELTARWEKKLLDIASGKLKQQVFLNEIRDYTKEIVNEIKGSEGTYRHENITNKICPDCGKRLLAVNGKNAKMLVCQDRDCGYKETVSRTSNARCPKCHKRMEMLLKGKEETFVCVCGYKEKLSSFKERRSKEGGGIKKRDVQKYMRQQQKEAEAPVNNALANALAGLKLEN